MADENSGIDRDRRMIVEAQAKGRLATFGAYFRLSGPGWLQSAITLGGGSRCSSLFVGELAGFAVLWLQPLALIMGIIMLSAISYVTLSTGEKPFKAIREHVNPVLGWGWILATLMANCVWALPQFGLAFGNHLAITHAAREGARMAAVGAFNEVSVRSRAYPVDPSAVTVAYPNGNLHGEPVVVRIEYDMTINIPFFGERELPLSSEARMRLEV